MMDHQINDKDGQSNGNTSESQQQQQQEGLESTITSGHVLDHVQCQPQRVTMATRTPSSLPMKPQLDTSNTYVTDSTSTTILPSSSSIGTVEYQNQHGSSYFANALTTLQMQHALKLAVNANSQQQPQNFSEGFPNSSSQATMYNGVRSANTLSPPLNNHLNQFSSSGSSPSTMTIPTGLPTTPIVTSSPSSSLASAARLASMGVAFGRGVNPNIPNPQAALNGGGNGGGTGTGDANSLSNGGTGMVNQNNPPIVNTGNNGPMCVQPGDWVCLQCGFVNWRRRKICMRCYPLLDQSNELSRSIMNGANLAAQIAAGIEPSPELLASLTTTNAKKTSTVQSTSMSNSSSQSPAHPSQQSYSSNLNYANNDLFSPSPSPLQAVSSSSVLRTYQQNGYKQNQDETVENSLTWSLQNGLNMSDTQQAATTTNMHNYTSGNRMFSSNRPSPMQTPLPSSTFDNNSSFNNLPPIAKPSHSIRQSQSFSMLSSLNGFTSCSTENAASPYTSNSKSAFATPKEEKQFSKAQELWFGNKQPSETPTSLANGGGLSSAKTAMVWNTINNQEEKGKTFSEFRFPAAKPSIPKNDNPKGMNDQIENNFSFTTAYKQESSEPLYEPVKVSAANESDEIVVPCGSEVSKPLQEYPQQQQLPQKSSFNRLIPIGKAAIEPPSSSSSSSSSSILTTKPRSTTCSSSSSTSSSTLKPAAATSSLTQASSFKQHQNYQV